MLKSATQARKTREKKGIHSLLIFTESISFSLTLRTFSHLTSELNDEKGKKDIKYFLEDRIYNIIKLRSFQPFHTIIEVSSIISPLRFTELCLLITDTSRTIGCHPTVLNISNIRFKVVWADALCCRPSRCCPQILFIITKWHSYNNCK